MKLYNQILQTGNYIFKYRGQIPVFLLILVIPIIYETTYYNLLKTHITSIIQYFGLLISILGLFVRYITIATTPKGTSGRNRNLQIAEELNTKGIYSIVRNPLYLANFIIWVGISVYSLSYILTILICLLFIIKYERIILVEEDFLSRKFGSQYEDFSQKTSIFFPKFTNYIKSNHKFSFKKILRQEYSSSLSVIISFIFIDLILGFSSTGNIVITQIHMTILSISLVLTSVLKILKKYTEILNEK